MSTHTESKAPCIQQICSDLQLCRPPSPEHEGCGRRTAQPVPKGPANSLVGGDVPKSNLREHHGGPPTGLRPGTTSACDLLFQRLLHSTAATKLPGR